MKATAEVHYKVQAGPDAGQVITQQPIMDEVKMEDIALNTDEDATDGGIHDGLPLNESTEAIELKDMSENSKDDSGISADVTTDFSHDENVTNSTAESENNVKDNVENPDNGVEDKDSDGAKLNTNNINKDNDIKSESKAPELILTVTNEMSVVKDTRNSQTIEYSSGKQEVASLNVEVQEDRISECSFDADTDRELCDSRVDDQASLVEVEVEVKDEMEMLSNAIAEVQLEDGKLFEAKVKYQRDLREARLKLYRMYKTHRQAIEKTKPYYVARELEKEMKAELDQTETDAERAKLNFEAAKELEAIAMEAMSSTKAEHGSIGSQGHEGKEALENWNQATSRVLETSKCRAEIEDRLRRKEEQFLQAERSANTLFVELKKLIDKAWPYYAMKDQYQITLDKRKREVRECGQRLAVAKEKYKLTFSRLNLVATEIHQRKTINERQSGLGANDNFSQFEEIHDIDTVLSALESKAENLSSCIDGIDDDDEGDLEAELTIMPKSKSLFSIGRSNTRESLDDIYDVKHVMDTKGRRKTLSQLSF